MTITFYFLFFNKATLKLNKIKMCKPPAMNILGIIIIIMVNVKRKVNNYTRGGSDRKCFTFTIHNREITNLR